MNAPADEVKSALLKKGVITEEALFSLKTDMGRDLYFCDAYTVVTTEGIATLFYSFGLTGEKSASFLFSKQKKAKEVFSESDYLFTPIDEVESVQIEEQTSHLVLTAKKKNGDVVILFRATCACRNLLVSFVEDFEVFLETGSFPERKMPEMAVCPRCHTPYRNPERKKCEKCGKGRNLLLKLVPFFLRYRLQMLLVLITVLLSGAVSVITPYLTSKVLYDKVLTPGQELYGKVLLLVGAVAAAALLNAVVRMVNCFVGAKVSSFVSYDLKHTIFSSFERLSFSFFTSRHTGRLITQINSDAETLYWFFCDGVPYFLTNILQMVGVLAVMLWTNPLLTLLVCIPIPFVFFGYWVVLKMFRKLHAENHTHRSRFNSVLSDVLGGMRVVKAFSRESTEIVRFDSRSRALSASTLKINLRNHTIFPLLNLGIHLTTYLVWGAGAWLVLRNGIEAGSGMTFGELSLFVSYLSMLYTPLHFFSQFFGHFASCLNALQRLFEIMETEPEVKEKENPVDVSRIRGEVTFENVDFSYVPGKKTIKDVSFHVPAGKTLGIVGHTGAGKSTLANLLTRLYDASSGRILIDGVDIKELSFKTLRRNIAIVSQETYLFRDTLLENIRYANPEADREDVLRAARAAGCHDFIMSFPDGYETMVGVDKKMLSGGEKQRISIARAILKDPAILILDEATAAMDTKTERRIQTALSELCRNRTTITIAHRLSTLRDADSLIVIEDGAVAEAGTHNELLKKEEGLYKKLYRLQMEAMRTIGIEE